MITYSLPAGHGHPWWWQHFGPPTSRELVLALAALATAVVLTALAALLRGAR